VETISRGVILPGGSVPVPAGARALDFVFTGVALRPLDERAASVWRERGVCGIRDWLPGVERDVTGRECDFYGLGSVVKVPAAGDRKFGVVKEAGGSLYFGRLSPSLDGSRPDRRPTELDPSPYRKVE
jgi:hypothetical protein